MSVAHKICMDRTSRTSIAFVVCGLRCGAVWCGGDGGAVRCGACVRLRVLPARIALSSRRSASVWRRVH